MVTNAERTQASSSEGIMEQTGRAEDLNSSSALPSAVTWAGYGPLPPPPQSPPSFSFLVCKMRLRVASGMN